MKGVSVCAAAFLILKIVGTSTCISNPEKEAGHIHANYVCLDMLTTVILGDFCAESMQVMSTAHLHLSLQSQVGVKQ